MSKATNQNLCEARKAKFDEFYTSITDISNELNHYKSKFSGKVVYCNCDDPKETDFWKYFSLNFEELNLKKVIATHFDLKKGTYKLELFPNGKSKKSRLKENG